MIKTRLQNIYSQIMRFPVISAVFGASLLLIVIAGIWAYSALGYISQPIILHFNQEKGITRTGTLWDLYGLLITAAAVVIINFALALKLEEKDRFLGKLVTGTTLLFAVLLFISLAAIINVN